jgi:mannan endo-1,4-beta-mannosidase
LHDATGKWEELELCVDYWVRPDVVEVVKRHRKYLLLNIGNEIGDNSVTAEQLKKEGYCNAINRIRRAGVDVPLVIEASDWGKDFKVLKAAAADLVAADPLHNIMFSIHMWWPAMWGYNEESVKNAIRDAVALNMPLIVGEFGK